MVIQPNMKIGSIVRRPEFKGYEHVAGEMPGFMGKMSNHMTIETMCRMVKTWDAEALASGMDYLLECAKSKRHFMISGRRKIRREKRPKSLPVWQHFL